MCETHDKAKVYAVLNINSSSRAISPTKQNFFGTLYKHSGDCPEALYRKQHHNICIFGNVEVEITIFVKTQVHRNVRLLYRGGVGIQKASYCQPSLLAMQELEFFWLLGFEYKPCNITLQHDMMVVDERHNNAPKILSCRQSFLKEFF